MANVLVTGMSGTGKSSALVELGRLGFPVVDTETAWDEWHRWVPPSGADEGEWVWREDRIDALLAEVRDRPLYVSGTVSNQGAFYDRFDAVVLLSAPAEVILERIDQRTTNSYGRGQGERELILVHLETVEPLLRATATHELDACATARSGRGGAGRDRSERRGVKELVLDRPRCAPTGVICGRRSASRRCRRPPRTGPARQAR